MAKQSRSRGEPAGLSQGFGNDIDASGLGTSSGGGGDGQVAVNLAFPKRRTPAAYPSPDDYQWQSGSPATPNNDFTIPLPTNWNGWSPFDYNPETWNGDTTTFDNGFLAPQLDPSLFWPTWDTLSPPPHSLLDYEPEIFRYSPTPALTEADSPATATAPGHPRQVGSPAATNSHAATPSRSAAIEKLACHICGKSVKGARSLARHMHEVHGNTGFQCKCGHCSPRKSNYTRHLNSCKALTKSQTARRDHFICSCGAEHTELRDHQQHIALCGRKKVGRPCRAA